MASKAWLRALAFVAVGLTFMTVSATAAPPNVVLIISDDQGWGDYSFMGHPHVHTPNLDRPTVPLGDRGRLEVDRTGRGERAGRQGRAVPAGGRPAREEGPGGARAAAGRAAETA